MAAAVQEHRRCPRCTEKAEAAELTQMKMSYYLLLEQIISTLLKNNVDPQKVLNVLPRQATSEVDDLKGKDIQELFQVGSPIYEVLGWRKVVVLAQLLDICKDDECRAAFQNYCANLLSYNIKHGSAIYVGDNYISIQSGAIPN